MTNVFIFGKVNKHLFCAIKKQEKEFENIFWEDLHSEMTFR